MRIKQLEKKLKMDLFAREPYGLNVTGRRVLPVFTRLLAAQQEALAALAVDPERPVRLRLGVIESVLHSSLGGLITELRVHEPKLQLEMAVHTSLELERLVQHGTLDVVVAASAASGKHVHTSAATAMRMAFVGNRQLHTKSRYAMHELAELGLVGFQPQSQPYRELKKLLKQSSREGVVHTGSSISGMVALVTAGFGVATLPRLVAERLAEREPVLRILECEHELAPLPLHVSYRIDPGEPGHSALIRRVVAFMKRKPKAR